MLSLLRLYIFRALSPVVAVAQEQSLIPATLSTLSSPVSLPALVSVLSPDPAPARHQAARQLAADETNILITLLLGHSSSSQGTHAVSHFNTGTSLADLNSPAWVTGKVAAMVVVTQDNLTLDQKLKTLKSAETERTHAAISI